MQVKDLLQQVVDEGWVTQEKIGTSNYYWAFKSQDINQVNNYLLLYYMICLFIFIRNESELQSKKNK